MKTFVKDELKYAKGMVERRADIVADIGNEEKAGFAVENFRSMVMCLHECEKHHNNVVSVVDDETAGVALETSMLVDWSRRWVAQAENVLRSKWGYTDRQVDELRRAVPRW